MRKLTNCPGFSVVVFPPPAQVVWLGQMIFVIVVAAWSSTLYAKRGVASASAERASEGLLLRERPVVSGLGAALAGATNAGKLMLARSSRLSAAEGRRRDGNPRIITLPLFPRARPGADARWPRTHRAAAARRCQDRNTPPST